MFYKLITPCLSKRYRLIHRQNYYAPRRRRRTGRSEAQSRELVKGVNILPVDADENIFVSVNVGPEHLLASHMEAHSSC
jgi:hypothetical protein